MWGGIRKAIVNKCENYGTVKTITGGTSGGIVSYESSGNISECINNGSVSANTSHAGGIVGYMDSGDINNCSNNGIITSHIRFAGGIVGIITSSSAKLTNIYNIGKVVSENNSIAGGIAGSSSEGEIRNAYNRGEIEGGIIGGICGVRIGGTLLKTFYYTESNTLKGIGSSSIDEIIAVEDVAGQVEKTEQQFNSRREFLNSI